MSRNAFLDTGEAYPKSPFPLEDIAETLFIPLCKFRGSCYTVFFKGGLSVPYGLEEVFELGVGQPCNLESKMLLLLSSGGFAVCLDMEGG